MKIHHGHTKIYGYTFSFGAACFFTEEEYKKAVAGLRKRYDNKLPGFTSWESQIPNYVFNDAAYDYFVDNGTIDTSDIAFDNLKSHAGHEIECVTYDHEDETYNVSVECITCGCVIVDYDKEIW